MVRPVTSLTIIIQIVGLNTIVAAGPVPDDKAGAHPAATAADKVDAPAADGGDHTPPVIDHKHVRRVDPGAGISIVARITDPSGVALPRLYFRTPGRADFSSTNMVAAKDRGRYVGTIPSMVVTEAGVEYYIEAFDVQGNGPTFHGTALAPHRVIVLEKPKKKEPAPSTPWYKTWWLWTGVGVVVAGAVTTAVVLSMDGDDGTGHALRVIAPAPRPTK